MFASSGSADRSGDRTIRRHVRPRGGAGTRLGSAMAATAGMAASTGLSAHVFAPTQRAACALAMAYRALRGRPALRVLAARASSTAFAAAAAAAAVATAAAARASSTAFAAAAVAAAALAGAFADGTGSLRESGRERQQHRRCHAERATQQQPPP